MDKIKLFSNRLNELLNFRKPKKIKKTELAAVLYVTPQTVSRWCNGVILPDRGTIELITKKVNEMYGYPPDSPQRYRSEYLAGEDNIPTYDFVSPKIMEYISQEKREQHFAEQIIPHIQELMNSIGYDSNQINDVKHFTKFVTEYIKIAIKTYMENVNPQRKDGE